MRFSLVLIAALLGCATLKDDQTVCPEYRGIRCAAGTQCSMDRTRGCQVCHCETIAPSGADGNPSLPQPPGAEPR